MDVMVSRQPIVDRNLAVAAYELLFHASRLTDHFAELDDTTAATRLITDALLTLGIDQITDGHPAIIAVSEALLLGPEVEALPSSVAVALPADVPPTAEVLIACAALKDRGNQLVLMDYGVGPQRRAFLPLADLAVLDIASLPQPQRRQLVALLAGQGVGVIARGVETRAAYEAALAAGCSYFQGYFFSRPSLISGGEIASSKLSALQLLKAAHRPDLDFDELERLILRDPAIAWKFLAYLNSVEFSWRRRIESVRHGLVMLGERATRTWVSLVTVSAMVGPTSPELSRLAITRGRFCELLGAAARTDATALDLFMTGTFSLVDGLLDRPLPVAVAQVPLSAEAKAAILGEVNAPGRVLRAVTAYERGHWEQLFTIAQQLGVDGAEVNRCYMAAVEWADGLLDDTRTKPAESALA